MLTSPPQKRDRCRSCGRVLPAWLPVMQEPDGLMLLHHLSLIHPAEVGPYLERMRTDVVTRFEKETSPCHVYDSFKPRMQPGWGWSTMPIWPC
jgi:hypothetical protein